MGTIYTFSLVAVLSLYLFLQLISRSKVSGLIGGYFIEELFPTYKDFSFKVCMWKEEVKRKGVCFTSKSLRLGIHLD